MSTVKTILISLFVLRFYGPVNPVGSCRARSVVVGHLLEIIIDHRLASVAAADVIFRLLSVPE